MEDELIFSVHFRFCPALALCTKTGYRNDAYTVHSCNIPMYSRDGTLCKVCSHQNCFFSSAQHERVHMFPHILLYWLRHQKCPRSFIEHHHHAFTVFPCFKCYECAVSRVGDNMPKHTLFSDDQKRSKLLAAGTPINKDSFTVFSNDK
jgi:hypothetical protein